MVPRWVIRMQELVGRLGAAMKSRASALLFLPSCSHHAPGATGRQRPTMTSTGISGWMMNPSFDLMPSELASFSPCFPHGHVRSETKTCRARRQGAVRNYQDLPRSMSQYQARVGLGSILTTHLIRLGRPRGRGKGKHQGHLLLMEVAAQQAGVPSASLERNLASLASASEVLWSSADLGLAILPRLLPHIRVAFALGETRTRGGAGQWRHRFSQAPDHRNRVRITASTLQFRGFVGWTPFDQVGHFFPSSTQGSLTTWLWPV